MDFLSDSARADVSELFHAARCGSAPHFWRPNAPVRHDRTLVAGTSPAQPFLFMNTTRQRQALMCISAKGGSTAWYTALLHGVGRDTHRPHYQTLPTSSYKGSLELATQLATKTSALSNPSYPRVLLARDPYARLISGFLFVRTCKEKGQGRRKLHFEFNTNVIALTTPLIARLHAHSHHALAPLHPA